MGTKSPDAPRLACKLVEKVFVIGKKFFDWLKGFFDFCGKFFLIEKSFFDGFPKEGLGVSPESPIILY